MFLIEVINKTVKEESHAQEICDFMIRSFITLDQVEKAENFHLHFLLKLRRFLGFGVHHVNDVLASRITSEENEKILFRLLNSEYTDQVVITNHQRREILELIVKFYSHHIENMGEIKSIQVLREIF